MWHLYSIHIICIDVDIKCRYTTLLYFIAQQNVYKLPVTCLGFKGHSEVLKKQDACKREEGVKKSKFSCVRTKWIAPELFALFPVRHLEKGFQGRMYKSMGIKTFQRPSMSVLAILCSESFNQKCKSELFSQQLKEKD